MSDHSHKPNLIFLHGTCGDKNSVELIGDLARDFNLHSFNLPAHGGETADGIEKMNDIASFVHRKIQNFKLDSYTIIGFSLGGLVALKYAENFQNDERLKSIIVWASPILPDISQTTIISRFNLLMYKNIPDSIFNFVVNGPIANVMNRFTSVKLNGIRKRDIGKIVKILETDIDYDLKNPIKKLFIFGARDLIIGNKCAQYLTSLDPVNSQIKIVRRGGHLPSRKGLEEVMKAVREFI